MRYTVKYTKPGQYVVSSDPNARRPLPHGSQRHMQVCHWDGSECHHFDQPTVACKRYGCHRNPTTGRCNRCGRET